MMTSAGSGCRYCQAHTSSNASRFGISEEKLAAIWEFETSDHFDDAERAALRVAFGAGQSPNQVSDDDFAALKQHYNDDQATAIVSVIAMFGFLNRWNDTMATPSNPSRSSSPSECSLVVAGSRASTPAERYPSRCPPACCGGPAS